MADQPAAAEGAKREAEVPLSEGPLLKRKKTVTWADGELELEPELSPLSRLPSSGAAADLAAGGSGSSGSGSGSGSCASYMLPCMHCGSACAAPTYCQHQPGARLLDVAHAGSAQGRRSGCAS